MEEIITLDCIRVGEHADSWEEAIGVAAVPLVENGSIEASYVQRMIDSVHELGPYIVIMPGLALAHAAPEPDVHESNLSLSTFKNDIHFGSENDPVRVVLCLACTDREAHVARLQKVAERLLEDEIVERMLACATQNELYQLINA